VLSTQKTCANSPDIRKTYFYTYDCPIRKVPLRPARNVLLAAEESFVKKPA
jgi:hypothetical protein